MLRLACLTQAGRRALLVAAATGVLLVALAGATPAFAEGPWWRLSSTAAPTYLPPGGEARIVLAASDVGDTPVSGSGSPITITDALPAGLIVTALKPTGESGHPGEPLGAICSSSSSGSLPPRSVVSCEFKSPLPAYRRVEVEITVKVEEPLDVITSLANEVEVRGGDALLCREVPAKTGKFTGSFCQVEGSGGDFETQLGGEVPGASLRQSLEIDGEPTPFGVEGYQLTPENEGGSPDAQAGSHPFQLTTTLDLNETADSYLQGTLPSAPALPKDLHFDLPPGLIGNPNAVPRCSEAQFNSGNACPSDTVVGEATVTITDTGTEFNVGFETLTVPVFNLVHSLGEPARFGFVVEEVPIYLDTSVQSGGDYGVVVSVSNISQAVQLLSSQVTFWGVPGDARHDRSRGSCGLTLPGGSGNECIPLGQSQPAPFLTLPTSCAGPLKTTMGGDSWAGNPLQGEYIFLNSGGGPLELEGCGELPFSPSIGVEPEQRSASTPTGLKVDVQLPQQSTLEAEGRAEADVKDTTVTLPEGVQLSPSAATGLQACSLEQIGFTGVNPETHTDEFTPAPASCPNASKVGIVHIKSPILPDEPGEQGEPEKEGELEGGVYLAAQDANPFGSLVAIYLVADSPVSGVLVKLAGNVTLNQTTGQLVTTFENTPQLPFDDLKLEFFGGPRAALSTPAACGTYTTTSSFTPWSGGAEAAPSSPFEITSGPGGSACQSPQPFAPGFVAQSTNPQAGAFTPFTLEMTRPDADQALQSLSLRLPAGVAALLSSVAPCPEPQAAQGTCGPESLIGHSTASAGLGPEPYALPGQVFLTGPYKGAPFGLSVVTPAVAGPFNLGDVVVRSTINVNPTTAAVTITSDPFPTIIQGIPTQLQRINVTIDRSGFQFNPTNCAPTAITGTLSGAQGASEAVSSPFRVANCASLPFKPKLTASSGGHASKAGGASLDVKITSAGLGQANIHKVDLTLPKALPSRLTTLHKACLDAVFDANPAACDAGSVIGAAIVRTPILKSPLRGPAYLVSHGGAAFPDVEFVLQGEGITLIIDGETDIKGGITYSKFETAPDAPFTSFETVLPTGSHSVFTANVPVKAKYSLCGTSLAMPTEITGQNGAVIKQTTEIAVTGCAKVKKLTRAQKLEKALKACKTDRKKAKRAKCKKQALKKYGPGEKKAKKKGGLSR